MENLNNKTKHSKVRFSDLVIALSELSGVPIEEMDIDIISKDTFFEGALTLDEIEKLIDPKVNTYNVNISANKGNNGFAYSFIFPLDLSKVQSDGKTLKDHCSAKHFMIHDYNPNEEVPATYIDFDNAPEDLILEIPQEMIDFRTKTNLLALAVQNCQNNQPKSIQQKQMI